MKNLNLYFKPLTYGFITVAFAAVFLLAGCDKNTTEKDTKVLITDALIQLNGSDDTAKFETGEAVKFTGFAITESGDKVPLSELGDDWHWEWQSTDPSVFTVDNKGNAYGEKEGEAYCVIKLNGPEERIEFTSSEPIILPRANARIRFIRPRGLAIFDTLYVRIAIP